MTVRLSVFATLLACSMCSAQSYSCGVATAPGAPTLSKYSCTVPLAPFTQTGTFNAYCFAQPLFGGQTSGAGSGSINASAGGTCGVMGQNCLPNFSTIQSDNGSAVAAWGYNIVSPVGCIHGSGQEGTSYTCTANCKECAVGTDVCPCTTGVTCQGGCCCRAGKACGGTPIVLDTFNDGFHLTSLDDGVRFRVLPGGPLYQMSWTDANWRNGWLALDRNGNGTIDDFTELFGNYTPQPPSNDPNGFLALAEFDDPANGGNGNGFIDPGDSVYSSLRVWIDANHNGFSEPNELHTLQELGIFKIGLAFSETPFVDKYGNRFRYKGSVWEQDGTERVCYDVFLQIQGN